MTSYALSPEILGPIVDNLQDEPATLKACCLASKALIPHARKYLFARVEFHAVDPPGVKLWKKAFPNPSNSPARYTRSLILYGVPYISDVDTGEGGWIRTFGNLVHLHVEAVKNECPVSLISLRGLLPTLKSLRLLYTDTPTWEILDLVCSFPLLEDLSLLSLSHDEEGSRWSIPLTPPKFSGTLDIAVRPGMYSLVRQLCDLPGGLRFTKISLAHLGKDLDLAARLVSRCSDTLESLSISRDGFHPSTLAFSGVLSFDFSETKKLKDLTFQCASPHFWWIIMALETIGSESLQQITIDLHATDFGRPIRDGVRQECLNLDRVLVQLCARHSIRLRVVCGQGGGNQYLLPRLLPEATRGGFTDLINRPYVH